MEIVLKLDNFEGPLDLLLNLIESKKIKISDISIHKLIDEYLEVLRINQLYKNFEIKSDFLVLASELIEIKTLSILNLDKEKEKQKELIRKLEDYKLFKDITKNIAAIENEYNIAYTRGLAVREIKKIKKDYIIKDINRDDIYNTFKKFLDIDLLNKKINLNFDKKYILSDEMDNILILIFENPKTFEEIFSHAKDRMHLIYLFLAILELYKESKIIISNNMIEKK